MPSDATAAAAATRDGGGPPTVPTAAWHAYVTLVATLLAHGVVLAGGDFVLDDGKVLTNPVVRGEAPLSTLLTTDYWGGRGAHSIGSYRPIAVLCLWLEHRAFGDAPLGYHVVSLAMMWLCAWLITRLAARLHVAPWVGLLAAVLFAVHPLGTEVVASISGRADLLAAIFMLLGLWLHGRAGPRARLAALLCVALGLGSKELLSTFAAAALGLELWLLGESRSLRPMADRLRDVRWRFLGAYAAMTAALLSARATVTGAFTQLADVAAIDNALVGEGPWVRVLNGPRLLWHYAQQLAVPTQLSPVRSFDAVPIARSLAAPEVWLGVAIVGVFVAVALGARARSSAGLLCWLALCFYAPVANVALLPPKMVADRWMFLPMIPLSLLVAIGLGACVRRVVASGRVLTLALGVGLGSYLLMLTAITAHYTLHFRSELDLFAYAVHSVPRSAKARFGLGNALLDNGRPRAAAEQYEAALSILPDFEHIRFPLAHAYEQAGDLAAAEAQLRTLADRLPAAEPEGRIALEALLRRHRRAQQPLPPPPGPPLSPSPSTPPPSPP